MSAKLSLEKVRERVLALELPLGDYALFGSVPMLASGLLECVGDIDIVARGTAWSKAQSLGTTETAEHGDKVVRLPGHVDIFDGWLGVSPDSIIEKATVIDGLPYADLRDVLAFKQKLNRVKDQEHLEKLRHYLAKN